MQLIDRLPSTKQGSIWTTIKAETTNEQSYEAQCLLLSTGAKPNIPKIYVPHMGERLLHTSCFATQIGKITNPKDIRNVAVIGSGMSAGEIILDFRTRFPNANIHSIHRSHGFKLNDLSNFSSEIYSPEETDYIYNLSPEGRENVLRESWQTNYSGLDSDGSSELYNAIYLDEVEGRQRVFMEKRNLVDQVQPEGQGFQLHLRDPHNSDTKNLLCDLVIIATGYRADPMAGILGYLSDHLVLDEKQRPVVGRNYKVATKPSLAVDIYLNGLCEYSHGISDTQSFSLLADRSGWILDDMIQQQAKADTPLCNTLLSAG